MNKPIIRDYDRNEQLLPPASKNRMANFKCLQSKLINLSSHNLSHERIKEIDQGLLKCASKSHNELILNKSSQKQALKQSLAEAILDWDCTWDINLSLVVPKGNPAYSSSTHLSKFLHGYFKAIEAIVFKGVPRRNRRSITKVVVLEHADGIGWHCHVIIASPENTSTDELNRIMQHEWFKRIGIYDNAKFNPERFYHSTCHHDKFVAYSLKHAIDTNNHNLELAKGIIDAYNCNN